MRTCTTMVYTDGRESVHHVMVGPMRGGKVFDAHKATIIARYRFTSPVGDFVLLYRALTARHATKAAPAVPWQRGDVPTAALYANLEGNRI